MAKTKRPKYKFEFGTDFQEIILQFTVSDPKGFKILQLYEDSYFTLIPHAIVAYVLKRYYKKEKSIPDEPYLREALRVAYRMDKIMQMNLTDDDVREVDAIVERIYSGPVKHPDFVIQKCINFARFIGVKQVMEDVDINDYNSYEQAIEKLRAANNIGFEMENNYGTFLVSGMKDRAHKRDQTHASHPTPWRQLNNILNSGGTETGNVITILSKEKIGKTIALLNVSIGYLRRKKKGFYADLENGEMGIIVRGEQNIANVEQGIIKSGEIDEKLLKTFRKYSRIGAELAVKKFPNLKTTTDDIQAWLDLLKRDFGFIPEFGVIDYGLLMGSLSQKTDDFFRIGDAFLDIKNFADHNKLDALWTAAHTTREGNARLGTKFKSTDIAKCYDIPKHIDMLLGLQQNEDEKEAGVFRFEVIEQRGGQEAGKMFFWINKATQRMREFTHEEIKEYYKQTKGEEEDNIPRKRKRKSDL
jgi:hypothetical protein